MNQPKNRSEKYDALFNDVDKGRIKIPQFQRDFVWSKSQTAKLIDSILKGYPIGTFIMWKTQDRLRHFRDIGNIQLPEPPSGDAVLYVLDGQQRMTSLYAVRKGIRIQKDGSEIDYRDIFINLDVPPDADEEVVMSIQEGEGTFISAHELLNSGIDLLAEKFPNHLKEISLCQKRLTTYDFSVIVIEDYEIDIACDIFTRINTGGKELTLFEIMVAKSYDHVREFDLAKEYEKLLDSNGKEKDLEDANYESLPSATVLQCIAALLLSKEVKRKDILKLERDAIVEVWPKVKKGIFAAVCTAIEFAPHHK